MPKLRGEKVDTDDQKIFILFEFSENIYKNARI